MASGAVACGMLAASPAMAQATPGAVAVPAWSSAQQLPGLSILNVGKSAAAEGLSCSSAGNCALGGSYTDGSRQTQAFVTGETNGTWGSPIEVPGTAALNKGGSATVTSVSCTGPGDCAVGGRYAPGGMAAGGQGRASEAFVASEKNAMWGDAVEVPGTAELNAGYSAGVSAVSCWSPGDCAAVGVYSPGADGRDSYSQTFVVTEKNGVWGTARELPGLAALNTARQATVGALSCAPASSGGAGWRGYCAAGGQYGSWSGTQAYVADFSGGTWQPAREYPGTAALNTVGGAAISSISCPSPGGCGIAGSVVEKGTGGTESGAAFVAGQDRATWGTPHLLSGAEPGNVISCGSPGSCAVGGIDTSNGTSAAFVLTEKGGKWGAPLAVPGLAGLDTGNDAGVEAVSCPSAGDCGAGGSYADTKAGTSDQAFVVTDTGGTWSTARRALPDSGTDDAQAGLISCVSPLSCTAAGFDDNGGDVFVVSTTNTSAAPAHT
jgi:hypothetical protein